MVGMFSSLVGSTMWLIIATFVSMPVSSTHSAGVYFDLNNSFSFLTNANPHQIGVPVGAVLGFTLTAKGLDGVDGGTLLFIAASWFLSPILGNYLSLSNNKHTRSHLARPHSGKRLDVFLCDYPPRDPATSFGIKKGAPVLSFLLRFHHSLHHSLCCV